MNLIFTIIFIISNAVLLFISPNSALQAMIDGGEKAVTLSVGLLVIYAVWSGIVQIAEDSGLNDKLSHLLSPIINKLFKGADDYTKKQITLNISANMLGMGGIATPAGINATERLTKNGQFDLSCLLFVLSATSLQILPTTVISLRQSLNSASPFDIFLPSILSSLVCTASGVLLYFITRSKK